MWGDPVLTLFLSITVIQNHCDTKVFFFFWYGQEKLLMIHQSCLEDGLGRFRFHWNFVIY